MINKLGFSSSLSTAKQINKDNTKQMSFGSRYNLPELPKLRTLSLKSVAKAKGIDHLDYRFADHMEESGLSICVTRKIGNTLDALKGWKEDLGAASMYPSGVLAIFQPKGLKPGISVFTDDSFRRSVLFGMGRTVTAAVGKLVQFSANAGDHINFVIRRDANTGFKVKIPQGTTDVIESLKTKGFGLKKVKYDGLVGGSVRNYILEEGVNLHLDTPVLKNQYVGVFNPKERRWAGMDAIEDNRTGKKPATTVLNDYLKGCIDHNGELEFKVQTVDSWTNVTRMENPLRDYRSGRL